MLNPKSDPRVAPRKGRRIVDAGSLPISEAEVAARKLRAMIDAGAGIAEEGLAGGRTELRSRLLAAAGVYQEQADRERREEIEWRAEAPAILPEWLENIYEQQPVLVLGAGRRPVDDAVNHNLPLPAGLAMDWIDLQRDLDLMPWDTEVEGQDRLAGTYGTIVALDVLEHIQDILGFTVECARLLRKGGLLILRYGASDNPAAYGDPTHRHWLMSSSLDFCCRGTSWGDHYGAFYVDTLGRRISRYERVSVERTNPDPRWPDNGDWLAVLRKL